MDNAPAGNQNFVEVQREKVFNLLREYSDPEKIKEALEGQKVNPEDGESSYMIYIREKQKNVVPMLLRALELMNSGKYGVCMKCGGKIEIERLEKVPSATDCCTCIKKENQKEIRKKRR